MTASARTLPILLPPVHHELLGSYLHRLADANHLTIRGLSHEIGPGRYHSRDSDDLTGWTPCAVTRLAALTGTTTTTLLHALPVLRTAALTGQPTLHGPPPPPWHAHACLLCAARRGVYGLAIIRVFPHERICRRHGRWHGGGTQRPLRTRLPEILHANARHRQLVRRQGTAAVTERFLQAQALTQQWLTGDGPADLKSRWEHRLSLLGEDPYGDPHRPSTDRIEIVTYPETVAMTSLALTRPAAIPPSSLRRLQELSQPFHQRAGQRAGPRTRSLSRSRRSGPAKHADRPQCDRRSHRKCQPPASGIGHCHDR